MSIYTYLDKKELREDLKHEKRVHEENIIKLKEKLAKIQDEIDVSCKIIKNIDRQLFEQ
jgi:hypothetical protein